MLQYGEGLPNTHLSIAQGGSFHKVCFAHKFFSIHMACSHMFSLQSFCSCSVWYTRQALTCMSWKCGASSFFENHFQGVFSFSMDLITNSYKFHMDTASEFEYALDSFTPIC